MLCVDLWCDFMFPCGLFSSARALEAPLAAPTSLQTDQNKKFKKLQNTYLIQIYASQSLALIRSTSCIWSIGYSICGADRVSDKNQIKYICSPCLQSSVEPPTLRGGDYAGILLFGGQSRKFLRCCIHHLQSNKWSDITKTEKHFFGSFAQDFECASSCLSLRSTFLFCFFLLLPLLLGFGCSTRGILNVLFVFWYLR